MLDAGVIRALSHITGGGIVGNTKRILPAGTALDIDWNSWEIPALFTIIQRSASIEMEEMREAFNLGIGMILCVDESDVDTVTAMCKEEHPVVLGRIVAY